MGQHRIGQIMKFVASCLPPESNKKITNHSKRKTVVAKLKNAGQPRHKIIHVTGHPRESSSDDYDEITVSERRELPHIASGYVPAPSSSMYICDFFNIFSINKSFPFAQFGACSFSKSISCMHERECSTSSSVQSVQTKFLHQRIWQNSPVCRRPCTAWPRNRISQRHIKFLTVVCLTPTT